MCVYAFDCFPTEKKASFWKIWEIILFRPIYIMKIQYKNNIYYGATETAQQQKAGTVLVEGWSSVSSTHFRKPISICSSSSVCSLTHIRTVLVFDTHTLHPLTHVSINFKKLKNFNIWYSFICDLEQVKVILGGRKRTIWGDAIIHIVWTSQGTSEVFIQKEL